MDYCTYHPLAPATYRCLSCHTSNCDHCADEGDRAGDINCFNCRQSLEHLGAVNVATPFWRRLQESFRYPLNANALVLIIVVSVLSIAASRLPFFFVWQLILAGTFLKYSFSCLESTATGKLIAPDITEAYSGGVLVVFHMYLLSAVAGGSLFLAAFYLGYGAVMLLGLVLILSTPAITIIYGLTGSLLEAINPLSVFRLITSIGLPYGLLLGFGLIMSASVGVISQLIGQHFTTLSILLQSMVANYYLIVMFHIMGYMIFQYQGALGFTAREDHGHGESIRSARDRLAAHINICLKEGDYNQVVALFEEALKQFPADREFNRQYFEFLYATKRNLANAASRYLNFLCDSGQEHLLVMVYKRVLLLNTDYLPPSAALRHQLAAICWEGGDSRSAVKLINGLHKLFPDYPELVRAYELMSDALEDLPHQSQQAEKCRQFTERLRKLKAQQAKHVPSPVPHQPKRPSATSAPTTTESSETIDSRDLPPIEFR